MIKAIFLDIDNTLLDFDAYVAQTLEVGLAHFGLATYEPWMADVFHRENNKLWRQIEEGSMVFADLEKIRFQRIFKALDIDFDGPTFEHYFRAQLYDCAIPVEGAYDLLENLSPHYILCAASNGPEKQQIHRIEIADMAPYFDYYFISQGMKASKPAREYYDEALARINQDRELPILPEECVMLGDSTSSDMAGGLDYGMKTVYYKRKGAKEPQPQVNATVENLQMVTREFIDSL